MEVSEPWLLKPGLQTLYHSRSSVEGVAMDELFMSVNAFEVPSLYRVVHT
jgi:hypothetical protein